MFYDAIENNHGLPRDPFKSLVVPRPIGWVSTLGPDGVLNLAPYSFFNAVGDCPHYVMFSSSGPKDSQSNVEATGSFVCSLATWELKDKMNATSAGVAADVDEFNMAGLTPVPSYFVAPPRVGESPVALECLYHQTLSLPGADDTEHYNVLIGKVVGIYIDDNVIVNGWIDVTKLRPIARLGYMEYCVVNEVFTMNRPG